MPIDARAGNSWSWTYPVVRIDGRDIVAYSPLPVQPPGAPSRA